MNPVQTPDEWLVERLVGIAGAEHKAAIEKAIIEWHEEVEIAQQFAYVAWLRESTEDIPF